MTSAVQHPFMHRVLDLLEGVVRASETGRGRRVSADSGVVVDRHLQRLPGGQRDTDRRSGAEQSLDRLRYDGQLAGRDIETDGTVGPGRSTRDFVPSGVGDDNGGCVDRLRRTFR